MKNMLICFNNKKILLTIFLSVSIFITALISCNKHSVNTVEQEINYKKVTADFIHNNKLDITRRPTWSQFWNNVKKFVTVAAMDIGGFVAAFPEGFKAGILVNPGYGLSWGITAGTAAGVLASDKGSMILPITPKYNPNWIPANCSNALNPYDYVGYLHYNILNDVSNNNTINYTNGVYNPQNLYEYTKNKIIMQGITGLPTFNTISYPFCDAVVTGLNISLTFSYDNFISGLNDAQVSGILSLNAKSILSDYFDAMLLLNASSDIAPFTAYSVNLENMVNSDASLSTNEKAMILSTMATSRYGINYWGYLP